MNRLLSRFEETHLLRQPKASFLNTREEKMNLEVFVQRKIPAAGLFSLGLERSAHHTLGALPIKDFSARQGFGNVVVKEGSVP